MRIPRRFLILFFTALVVLSSGVFSFGTVYADSIDTPPSPLRQNEIVIQQLTPVVAQKKNAIDDQQNQILQLLQVKQDLSQKLNSVQHDVNNLHKKIADQKAAVAAEKARIKALKDMFVHIDRYAFDAAGNLYVPGNCTWYVKSQRPDISNSWGNADMWYYNAQSQGWNVGSTPKKGAVGTTTRGSMGHVVYVEGVSLDGSIVTISEMNVLGLGITDTRTEAASDFQYIYELN